MELAEAVIWITWSILTTSILFWVWGTEVSWRDEPITDETFLDKLDTLPELLARLPNRLQWTMHNLLAHPLSEVLWQLGFHNASDYIHDITIPIHEDGSGRG